MKPVKSARRSALPAGLHQEELWLLGQPPLRKFLDFVEDTVVDGAKMRQSPLVDQWRAANERYYELEKTETGIADQIEIRRLDPGLAPLARRVRRDSRFTRAFDVVPTRFAMVELDKLVVPQPHVNLTHARNLMTRLGEKPRLEALFNFCLPLDTSNAKLQARKIGSQSYAFWSESNDFRFHEATLLSADQVTGYEPMGPIAGILGLVVGYGSNFLTAIESEKRLLLHNGHHRAYALRALGITHAPCLIQTVTRRDELNLIAPR
jgi:hypothetical protein